MRKYRPYKEMKTYTGMLVQWVGPRKPDGETISYLRFEKDGKYLGAIDGRQLRALHKRLVEYFK